MVQLQNSTKRFSTHFFFVAPLAYSYFMLIVNIIIATSTIVLSSYSIHHLRKSKLSPSRKTILIFIPVGNLVMGISQVVYSQSIWMFFDEMRYYFDIGIHITCVMMFYTLNIKFINCFDMYIRLKNIHRHVDFEQRYKILCSFMVFFCCNLFMLFRVLHDETFLAVLIYLCCVINLFIVITMYRMFCNECDKQIKEANRNEKELKKKQLIMRGFVVSFVLWITFATLYFSVILYADKKLPMHQIFTKPALSLMMDVSLVDSYILYITYVKDLAQKHDGRSTTSN